jgi:hypothetical protein
MQWVPGIFPEIKQLKREADHSPPSSVELKNAWSYTSTSPYVFMAWYLVKHMDNFTLLLPYDLGGRENDLRTEEHPISHQSPSHFATEGRSVSQSPVQLMTIF